MMRMQVEGVGFDQNRATVVVLKDWEGARLLPIWVGPNEARAIQIELEGAQPPRPMSHDLLLSVIGTARGRITRVVINDLLDSTFYATIDIDTPDGTKHIDARPSDAIAVAVRAKCPIFVDGGALDALVDAKDMNRASDEDEEREIESSELASEDDEELERFRRLLGDD